jgi:hypothetical protein
MTKLGLDASARTVLSWQGCPEAGETSRVLFENSIVCLVFLIVVVFGHTLHSPCVGMAVFMMPVIGVLSGYL